MAIRTHARAKINLCLHVTGVRADGYHLLDSVVAFADVADHLSFEPAHELTLSIDGPFAAALDRESDNLILRAARCFTGGTGCRVHLQKNLPIAAGIGGGSADAAAALRGFASLWNRPMPDLQAQLHLGADVPVCVAGSAARMQGIGQNLTLLPCLPDLPVVLINPGVAVSTPAVFAALQHKQNPGIADIPTRQLTVDAATDWLSAQRNDLQTPAITREPAIARVMQVLEQAGAELVRMSGSGATCFGVYKNKASADQAAGQIKAAWPDWWVSATVLRGSGYPGHNEV